MGAIEDPGGDMYDEPGEYVAQASSERGDVVLLRRAGDGAMELRVNGIFVMDTVHTSTERMLAATTMRQPVPEGARVLIGGLGLGFTLAEVLTDERVAEVHVVEIEPAVVAWNQAGLIPETASTLRDERVRLTLGDVREVLADAGPGSFDVILLDVDNGPGYLVYDENAAVYEHAFLALCRDKLSGDGLLTVWSADPSAELVAAMTIVVGHCEEITIPVDLGRETTYHLFIARRGTA